jgi:SET domain-containing protein
MIGTDADLPENFDLLMTPGIRPGDLYVGASGINGRGVYAARDFATGTIIEICPVILVPAAQRPALESTVIVEYYYEWGDAGGVALGFGSLYNHSYEPNAVYRKHMDRALVIVSALRSIACGEEITINYNGDPEDKNPIWNWAKDEEPDSARSGDSPPAGSGG